MSKSKLQPPSHFEKDEQLLGAWNDLMANVEPSLLVRENLFTLEITATLMAKFRGSKPLSATEMKELRKHLVTFGLARDESSGRGSNTNKSKNRSKYFS